MLLNITSMSCKHKTWLSPGWDHLFGACKYWEWVLSESGGEWRRANKKQGKVKLLGLSSPPGFPEHIQPCPISRASFPGAAVPPGQAGIRTGIPLSCCHCSLWSLLSNLDVISRRNFQAQILQTTGATKAGPGLPQQSWEWSRNWQLPSQILIADFQFPTLSEGAPFSVLDSPSEFPAQKFLCLNLSLSSCQCPAHGNPLVGT